MSVKPVGNRFSFFFPFSKCNLGIFIIFWCVYIFICFFFVCAVGRLLLRFFVVDFFFTSCISWCLTAANLSYCFEPNLSCYFQAQQTLANIKWSTIHTVKHTIRVRRVLVYGAPLWCCALQWISNNCPKCSWSKQQVSRFVLVTLLAYNARGHMAAATIWLYQIQLENRRPRMMMIIIIIQ